ncbi:hypothetical protein LPE509_01168 [Legionella pneumophila subsp. pneumophila LPE509]|nr:hypothetical protein LPE509_01168 [Legionella pneumophila subsp. pneumophila LPE509]
MQLLALLSPKFFEEFWNLPVLNSCKYQHRIEIYLDLRP